MYRLSAKSAFSKSMINSVITNLFAGRGRSILGVDIGSSAIKIVELESTSEGLKLAAALVDPIPSTLFTDTEMDVGGLAEVLRQAVVNSGTKTKKLALAVPSSAVVTRVVEMPKGLAEDDLEMQLLLEVENSIPYPLDEVSLDFTCTGLTDDGQKSKVLVVATRKKLIEDLTELAQLAELKLRFIDVQSFCLQRAYSLIAQQLEKQNEAVVAVADIGVAGLRLQVFDQGNSIYMAEQPFNLNKYFDRGSAEPAPENLAAFGDLVVQQASQALQTFYTSTSYGHLDALLLLGGAVGDGSIAERLESEISLPVLVGNPFTQMQFGNRIDTDQVGAIASSLGIATGLALRGIS